MRYLLAVAVLSLAGCANVSYRWPGEPIMLKAGQSFTQTADGTITIGTHSLPVPVEPDVELPGEGL